MKYTKHLALALALSLSFVSLTQAQSEGDDPLAGFAELEAALDELESLETETEAEGTETESTTEESTTNTEASTETSTETETENSSETPTESEETPAAKTVNSRLMPKEIPEGKENHLLYNIPGAIEYKGMTFLRIDSPRFFNRFQKCDTTENDKTYNALARLKISQGSPLECREDMKYQFMPYKTFRATR